ncbi:T9SS type A sorting domain-containing protein, partial [candidate division KSB1 bacterium]
TGHTLPAGSQNYIVAASFTGSIGLDDSVRIDIDSTMISSSGGSVTGSPGYVYGDSVRGLTHIVDTRFNVNSIELTNPGFGETTGMHIQVRTVISLPAASDEIVITFPDTLDISNITLLPSTMTPSGTAPSIDAVKSTGQTVVLNVGAPEPGGIYNLYFGNIRNPDRLVKNLTCIIFTREDGGTVLADEDETPARFAITGKIFLEKGTTPIMTDNLAPIQKTGGTKVPLTSFRLNTLGEGAVLDTVFIRPVLTRLNRNTVSNFDIYLDDGAGTDGIAGNGEIEGDEASVALIQVDDLGSDILLPIPITGQNLEVLEARDYIITADFTSALYSQNMIRIDLDSAATSIHATGVFTEARVASFGDSITGYTHTIPGLKLPELNDTTITEGQKLTINLAGPYTNIPGRLFDVDNMPRGARFNRESGLFEWTPDLSQSAQYPYTFSVSVAELSDADTISVTVLDIDPLRDLIHEDSTAFIPGRADTVQAKNTGIYKLHRTFSQPTSVTAITNAIVRQPDVPDFSLDRILEHPSTVEFAVEGFESGFTFADSVNITVEYKDFEVVQNEENMRIFVWEPAQEIWKQLSGYQQVDTDENTVTAKVNHFTIYSAQEIADTTYTYTLSYGWNMIGVPVEPDLPGSPDIVLGDDIRPFRLQEYNSSIYYYNTDSLLWSIPSIVHQGTGYIVWSFDDITTIDVSGLEALTDFSHSIDEDEQWLLASNPYNRSIDWTADVTLDNVKDVFYRWDGDQYLFYPDGGLGNTIQPWHAFFVQADAPNAGVTISYPGPEHAPKQSAAESPYEWRVQIKAQVFQGVVTDSDNSPQPGAIDFYNYFGRARDNTVPAGSLERAELVSLNSDYISLYFTRSTDGELLKMTQLIAADSINEYEWNMEIETTVLNGTVLLEWDIPEHVTEDWEITLFKKETGRSVDMAAIRTLYQHPGSEIQPPLSPTEITRYRIIAKRTGSVPDGITDKLPLYYYLDQNYPNPFNNETIIRYGLPDNDRVSLVIYNIHGQQVRRLVDEDQIANHYQVRWDGMNDAGYMSASGVYFFTLRTSKYSSTKKILLIK